jgi:hypothetical protein
MLMNYGKTFVLSMRELRVSVRNAIILLWRRLILLRCFPRKVLMTYTLAWMFL